MTTIGRFPGDRKADALHTVVDALVTHTGLPLSGNVEVHNLLGEHVSSENLNSNQWGTNATGVSIDSDSEDSVTFNASASNAGVRCYLESGISRGAVLTVSFTAWSPDIADYIRIRPVDAVTTYSPDEGESTILLTPDPTRYAVTIDTTGGTTELPDRHPSAYRSHGGRCH
jgi:hypothetical protein